MNDPMLGPIDQIGYVVADLDRSIARWRKRHDVGPWTVFRNVRLDGFHLGEPVTVAMDVAAYRGDLQIELIRVTNEARSPYRDTHGQPLVGLHHVAWVVDDLDAALARLTSRGLRVVFDARNPATRRLSRRHRRSRRARRSDRRRRHARHDRARHRRGPRMGRRRSGSHRRRGGRLRVSGPARPSHSQSKQLETTPKARWRWSRRCPRPGAKRKRAGSSPKAHAW